MLRCGNFVENREIRLANLRTLVREYADGNVSRFVEVAGLESAKGLLQVTGPKGTRNLGPGLARRIERELGLERGWMDRDHAVAPDTDPVPGGRTERALLAYSIIERLPPDIRQLADHFIDALTEPEKAKPKPRQRRRKK
jgi:hypothetical protein